jgi:hypothetical protein
METGKGRRLSRREFAQRAAIFSAAAPLASTGILPESAPPQTPAQQPDNLPKLSPEGQAEADARYQQILGQYGPRFSDSDKNTVRTLCIFLQPALEHVRAYTLANGDAPALYLKPLVEREKKPAATPSPKSPQPHSSKKP